MLALAAELTADGGTDLDGGLTYGYAFADAAFDPARINRVVSISDGIANVGQTNATLIGATADDQDKEAIYLVGVGVNDTLMDARFGCRSRSVPGGPTSCARESTWEAEVVWEGRW